MVNHSSFDFSTLSIEISTFENFQTTNLLKILFPKYVIYLTRSSLKRFIDDPASLINNPSRKSFIFLHLE